MNYSKLKVVMIGDSNVGKSSIATRASDNYFDPEKLETVGSDIITLTKESEGKKVDLVIWDTAGQERFKSLSNYYMKDSGAVIIVYAINDSSFNSVDEWFERANDTLADRNPYFILVGNKNDLYDTNENENGNFISESEGRNKADALGIDFLSVSALTGDSINEIFENIASYYFNKIKQEDIENGANHTVDITESACDAKKSCC
ncbi:hypothetical protein M9Y10_015496 [Tritrichomonas musculus]|uniref:Uncharacterized protein n=1 Tax=Tritrichomonas musculus TaxID=1915356 RepID=A0ABR2L2F0_9EUKA